MCDSSRWSGRQRQGVIKQAIACSTHQNRLQSWIITVQLLSCTAARITDCAICTLISIFEEILKDLEFFFGPGLSPVLELLQIGIMPLNVSVLLVSFVPCCCASGLCNYDLSCIGAQLVITRNIVVLPFIS